MNRRFAIFIRVRSALESPKRLKHTQDNQHPQQPKDANQAAWERGSKRGNSRKWLREGAKGLLDSGSKGLSRDSCTFGNLFFVAPVQPQFAPVQEAFRSLRPKDLLHPLLTTVGNFLLSNPWSKLQKSGVFVQKNAFSYRNMRFPAERCLVLQKLNLPTANSVFELQIAGNLRKLQGSSSKTAAGVLLKPSGVFWPFRRYN